MKNLRITVNGVSYDVQVEELGESASAAPAAAAPASAPAAKPALKKAAPAAGGKPVAAPMPGTVLDIKVSSGQAVKAGDVLLILEAMKMENEIKAPSDGTVSAVLVSKGESVDTGAALVTLA